MKEESKPPKAKSRSEDGADSLEKFERRVVFRTARGYFLFLAGLAILTFVGGVVFGARGLVAIEPDEPAAPTMPAPPAPPSALQLADVEKWIARQAEGATAVEDSAEPEWVTATREESDGADRKDPEAERFEKLLADFKALFPEPHYAWKDSYLRTCTRSSPYGCLRYERTLEKEGVSNILETAIRSELKGDSLPELNAILSTLNAVIAKAPLERRAELIAPTAEAHRELQADYRTSLREHEDAVYELEQQHALEIARYERELEELRAEKETNQLTGMYGVLAGLGLLVLVSVFLAHFAIERHLRLMREALAGRGV